MNDPNATRYRWTQLDLTVDALEQLHGKFWNATQDAIEACGGELLTIGGEFDTIYDKLGCRVATVMPLDLTVCVPLEEDDTPAEARRKLVAELRELASAIEEGRSLKPKLGIVSAAV